MRALIAIALALAAPASAAERVQMVVGFDRIRVEGPYRVEIVTGKGPSAKLIGSTAAIDLVRVEQVGKFLVVKPSRVKAITSERVNKDGPVTIRLTTGELRSAALIGSGSMTIDRLRGPSAELSLSGTGALSVTTVAIDRLQFSLTGSGRIALSGAAKAVRATVKGAGDVAAEGLVAGDLALLTESAGRVALAVRGPAKIISTGAGETIIGGKPVCDVTALGTGTVSCGR